MPINTCIFYNSFSLPYDWNFWDFSLPQYKTFLMTFSAKFYNSNVFRMLLMDSENAPCKLDLMINLGKSQKLHSFLYKNQWNWGSVWLFVIFPKFWGWIVLHLFLIWRGVGNLEIHRKTIYKATLDVLIEWEPICHILRPKWSLLYINVFYLKNL